MQAKTLKIGTRSSALALAQAEQVRAALCAAHNKPPHWAEIVPMSTAGDRALSQALSELGGKGLFTQEIEAALAEKRIDIAVHSAKDMPAELPQGLHLSAFLKREDPRDAFIGREAKSLADLPRGARIGTSSIRRRAMLARLRPDLRFCLLRGNVQTRLKKLEQGEADGTFLACAGLRRLGLAKRTDEILSAEQFVPAPGQGVIAIESRKGDKETDAWLAPLNNAKTAREIACERGFMAALDGSCRTPLGAYATLAGGILHLHGMILTPDGAQMREIRAQDTEENAESLGRRTAESLRAQAGSGFFDGWQ